MWCHRFQGEDLMNEERQRLQKEQIKAWLCQQIKEREAAEKERKEAEDAYKAAVIARDARAIELDQMEKDCRKRLELACARYNQALVLLFLTSVCLIALYDFVDERKGVFREGKTATRKGG